MKPKIIIVEYEKWHRPIMFIGFAAFVYGLLANTSWWPYQAMTVIGALEIVIVAVARHRFRMDTIQALEASGSLRTIDKIVFK